MTVTDENQDSQHPTRPRQPGHHYATPTRMEITERSLPTWQDMCRTTAPRMTVTDAPTRITLTPACRDVLAELVRDGADNATIADRLGLPVDTVKSRVKRVMQESGQPSRTALAVAYLTGAVQLEEPTPAPPPVRVGPVTHGWPRGSQLTTTCCRRMPTQLPDTDRVTSSPARVTCGGAK